MRLLVISPHFAPDIAPTGSIVTELVQNWCEQGHQVHVITSIPWYQNHEIAAEWKNCFIKRTTNGSVKITRVYPFPTKKSNLFFRGLGFFVLRPGEGQNSGFGPFFRGFVIEVQSRLLTKTRLHGRVRSVRPPRRWQIKHVTFAAAP